MKLQEQHKQFVVQGYAQFMKATDIVDTFMAEFQHELHIICNIVEANYEAFDVKNFDKYGFPLTEAEIEKFIKKHRIIRELSFAQRVQQMQDMLKSIRQKLLSAFRRLNITHSQFPEKYKELFHNTREQFCQSYRFNDLSIKENIVTELSTLYQFTKELAFKKRDLKSIAQATQILKTIAACNAINDQQQTIDITPQDTKELKDTAKTLTNQLKNETKQLEKYEEKQNA